MNNIVPFGEKSQSIVTKNWTRHTIIIESGFYFLDLHTPLTFHSNPFQLCEWNSFSFSIKPQKFTQKLQKCTQIKITFKTKTLLFTDKNEDSSELRDNFFHLSKSLVSSSY